MGVNSAREPSAVPAAKVMQGGQSAETTGGTVTELAALRSDNLHSNPEENAGGTRVKPAVCSQENAATAANNGNASGVIDKLVGAFREDKAAALRAAWTEKSSRGGREKRRELPRKISKLWAVNSERKSATGGKT